MTTTKQRPPICPYCSEPAELVDSEVIYGRSYGMVWLCKCIPGWSYVGVHKDSTKPKGSLADKATREARKKAHAIFDPLWLEPKHRRRQRRKLAYAWLSEAMGLAGWDCHIGMFDLDACTMVIELCEGKDKFE